MKKQADQNTAGANSSAILQAERALRHRALHVFFLIPVGPLVFQLLIRKALRMQDGFTTHFPTSIATTCIASFIGALMLFKNSVRVDKYIIYCLMITFGLYFWILIDAIPAPKPFWQDYWMVFRCAICSLFAIVGTYKSWRNELPDSG